MDKNKQNVLKRKFGTFRAVVDAVLNSDDDSDETNFFRFDLIFIITALLWQKY